MYTIYHIPGVKVGATSRKPGVRVRQQGYTQFEILEVLESLELASERELYWQVKLGYTRDSSATFSSTLKLSQSKKGIARPKETMLKVAKANTGKVRTQEQRERIAEAHKGIKQSPEQVAKRVETRRRTMLLKKLNK